MTALATASVPGSEAFASEFAARKARFAADPSWMAARRQAGIARFEALGLPTRKVEAWKYTDTQALGRQQYRLADDASLAPAVKDALALDVDAYRLVFVDGLYNASCPMWQACPTPCVSCRCLTPSSISRKSSAAR